MDSFNAIFDSCVRRIETTSIEANQSTIESSGDVTVSKPLKGPQPLTVEEYWRRTGKVPQQKPLDVPKAPTFKRKRGGKKFLKRKELALLYMKLNLATTIEEKKRLKIELNRKKFE